MKMKRMKKWLIAPLVLCMSVWALAGCGDGDSDGTYTASEVKSDLSMAQEVKDFYANVDMDYAYDLTYELAYSEELADYLGWRSAGSDAEHKTANYLVKKMKKIGLENVTKIGTPCDKFQFNNSSLKIEGTDIELHPASYQVNGTDGDLTAEIVDVGTGFEYDYDGKDVKGKIVLAKVDQQEEAWIDGYAEMAKEKGAAAIVTWADSGYGEDGTDTVNVQDVCCADILPITAISADDAAAIKDALDKGAKKATLNVDAEMVDNGGTTYNVVGMIPGKNHDKKIIYAGHYDKYWYGFQDDCAAIGLVLTIAKSMVDSKYQPENDIYFVCHGAEEWGVTDSMYDWTTGAWGMVDDKNFADDTLAMFNCELPAFANENGLQVACVPEFNTMTGKMFESGLVVTAGETAFGTKPVATTTMEDGISYREYGAPYFLNAFEGSDFMRTCYHTSHDNKDTYDADTLQSNINWYGAFGIYIDTEPALELDLTCAADQLEEDFNADYAEEAGVDTEEYLAAVGALRDAGTALNEKIAACNSAYEEAVAAGDEEAMKAAREEGAKLNDLSLEAFQMIQDDFLKVTDFTADYGHAPVNDNIKYIDGTLAGLEDGVLWAEDDSGSGACDQALYLNSIHEYNYCIFSKKIAKSGNDAYTPDYYKNKDEAQWGYKKQVPVVEVGEASYALFHAESVDDLDVDMVTKAYQKGRDDCLKAIADYSKQEVQSMGEITKLINNSLE